jgi:hypothetical protein
MPENLLVTVANDYIAPYLLNKVDTNENRTGEHGLFDYAIADTGNLINAVDIQANKTAESHTQKIPVLKNMTFSINATRNVTISGKQSESAYMTLVYATIMSSFDQIVALYANNYIKYQADFKHKMDALQRDWKTYIEGLLYSKLNTDKSRYNAADGNPYTLVGDVLKVPYADRELIFNEIDPIFEANDFNTGVINFVASPRTRALIGKILEFGANNDQNKAMTLGNKKFSFSNRITSSEGMAYSMFALMPGSIAMTNWNDIDAQMGAKASNGEIMELPLPLMGGMKGAYYQTREIKDMSGTYGNGYKRTLVEGYEISTDICLVVPYNSTPTTRASGNFKIEIEKA